MGRLRLTPALCRRQAKEIVIENYEAAVKVLLTYERGVAVAPSVLAKAKRQRSICFNELRRRGFTADELDYVPELRPDEVDRPEGADAGPTVPIEDPSGHIIRKNHQAETAVRV